MTGGLLNFTPLMPQGDSLAEELSLKAADDYLSTVDRIKVEGLKSFTKGRTIVVQLARPPDCTESPGTMPHGR